MLTKSLFWLILTNSCGQSVQGTKSPLFPTTTDRAKTDDVKGTVVEPKVEKPVIVEPVVVQKSYKDVEPILKEFCVTGCHVPGSSTLGGKKIYFDTAENIKLTFKTYAPEAVANTISNLRMPPKNVKRSDDMTTKQREDLAGWLKAGTDIETFKPDKTPK